MSTRPILTYFYTTINIDDDTWGKLKYLDLCNRTESWEQQKVNHMFKEHLLRAETYGILELKW